LCRYISSVALVKFAKVTSEKTPAGRMKVDRKLLEAMKGASRGVSTIIKIGSSIIEDESSLDGRLKELLPGATRQRIFTTYSLLLHCTFTVSDTTYVIMCTSHSIFYPSQCAIHFYILNEKVRKCLTLYLQLLCYHWEAAAAA